MSRREQKRRNYAPPASDGCCSSLRRGRAETILLLSWSGTDRELAAELGRSVQAVQVKRSRLRGTASKPGVPVLLK